MIDNIRQVIVLLLCVFNLSVQDLWNHHGNSVPYQTN